MRSKGKQLLFRKCGLDAREYLVLFEADMVVKPLAQADHEGFSQLVSLERFAEVLHARSNLGVVRKHVHDVAVLIEAEMAAVGRQEHLFLFSEVGLPTLLPKTKERFRSLPQLRATLGSRRLCCSGNLQCLHEHVVVMSAQGMKAAVTLHVMPPIGDSAGPARVR
jgi:hypothetical protein